MKPLVFHQQPTCADQLRGWSWAILSGGMVCLFGWGVWHEAHERYELDRDGQVIVGKVDAVDRVERRRRRGRISVSYRVHVVTGNGAFDINTDNAVPVGTFMEVIHIPDTDVARGLLEGQKKGNLLRQYLLSWKLLLFLAVSVGFGAYGAYQCYLLFVIYSGNYEIANSAAPVPTAPRARQRRLTPREAQAMKLADQAMTEASFDSSGDVADPLEMLDEAIRVAPKLAILYVRRGWIQYTSNNKHDDAARDFRRAAHMEPSLLEAFVHLADCYLDSGWPEGAIRECDKVLEIDDRMAAAYIIRARAYADVGRHNEAKRDEIMIKRLDPGESCDPCKRCLV